MQSPPQSTTPLVPSDDRCLQWAFTANDLAVCLHQHWRRQIQPLPSSLKRDPQQQQNMLALLKTSKNQEIKRIPSFGSFVESSCSGQRDLTPTTDDSVVGLRRNEQPFPSYLWWRSQLNVTATPTHLEVYSPECASSPSTSSPRESEKLKEATLGTTDPSMLSGSVMLMPNNGLRMAVYPNSKHATSSSSSSQRVPWLLQFVSSQVHLASRKDIVTAWSHHLSWYCFPSSSLSSMPMSLRVRLFHNPLEDIPVWQKVVPRNRIHGNETSSNGQNTVRFAPAPESVIVPPPPPSDVLHRNDTASNDSSTIWNAFLSAATGVDFLASFRNPRYQHRLTLTHQTTPPPRTIVRNNNPQSTDDSDASRHRFSVKMSDIYTSGPQKWDLSPSPITTSLDDSINSSNQSAAVKKDDNEMKEESKEKRTPLAFPAFPAVLYDWSCDASTLFQFGGFFPMSQHFGDSENRIRFQEKAQQSSPARVWNVSPMHSINADSPDPRRQHTDDATNRNVIVTSTTSKLTQWVQRHLSTIAATLSGRAMIEIPYCNQVTGDVKAIFRVRATGVMSATGWRNADCSFSPFASLPESYKELHGLSPMLPKSRSLLRGVSLRADGANPLGPRGAVPWWGGISFETQIPRPLVQITFHWACMWWGAPEYSSSSASTADRHLAIAGVSLSRRRGLEVGGPSTTEGQSRLTRWGDVVPQKLECGLQWFRVNGRGSPLSLVEGATAGAVAKKHYWSSGLFDPTKEQQQGVGGGSKRTARDAVALLGGMFQFRHLQCSIVWDGNED